jgi:septal ring factor EnvC (AmiA/AmiB activator)
MRNMMALLCLWAAGSLLAGCVNVQADASGFGKGDGTRYTSAPPPDQASDPRSISDLQRENAQLRGRLAELEKQHAGWQSAIDRQKDRIHALQRQRDDLKKDRDRTKKALRQEDD